MFPKALAELSSVGAQAFADGFGALVGDCSAGEKERRPPGEKERRPSGGGERALFVSGDWS